jgi:hypothetical protein
MVNYPIPNAPDVSWHHAMSFARRRLKSPFGRNPNSRMLDKVRISLLLIKGFEVENKR